MTGKQIAFVEHYCGECKFNATKAAEKAGYSPKTAYSIAGENLKKPEIIRAISEEIGNRAEKADVETAEIIAELRKLAFSGVLMFNNTDKLRALELLGKYKAIWVDRSQTDKLPEQKKLDEKEEAEANRLANIRLREGA